MTGMTKQETYDYLTNKGVSYEVTEHAAVFNMEELDAIELPYPDSDAKNLFTTLRNSERHMDCATCPLPPLKN